MVSFSNKSVVGASLTLLTAITLVSCSPKEAVVEQGGEIDIPKITPIEVEPTEVEPANVLSTPNLTPIDGDYNDAVATYDSGNCKAALPVLAKYSQDKDAGACLRVGVAYLNACGIEADNEAAVAHLTCAMEGGDNSANIWLATAYTQEGSVLRLGSAVEAYENSIKVQPNATAYLGLRALYLRPETEINQPVLSARNAVRGFLLSDVEPKLIINDLTTYYNCETLANAAIKEGATATSSCAGDEPMDRQAQAQKFLSSITKQARQADFYGVVSR